MRRNITGAGQRLAAIAAAAKKERWICMKKTMLQRSLIGIAVALGIGLTSNVHAAMYGVSLSVDGNTPVIQFDGNIKTFSPTTAKNIECITTGYAILSGYGNVAVSETVNFFGENIYFESSNNQATVWSRADKNVDSKLILGDSNTNNITILNTGDGIAVWASGDNTKSGSSYLELNAKEVNITAKEMAVHVQNNTQEVEAPKGAASVAINADTININSDSLGLSAFSNGQMNVKGNLTVNAPHAIDVRGNSTVNINTDGAHTTVLNGDIVFETPNAPGDPQNSGNLINAYVNVNFTGEESVWNGRAYKNYRIQDDNGEYVGIESVDWETPDRYGYVTGFKVSFKDGATWNLTGPSIVNDATFGAGSTLKIKGSDFEESTGKYALNGSGTLSVEEGAKLVIDGMEKNTYNIATGFATNQGENFTVVNDNALMQTEMKLTDKNLQAVVSAKTADEVAASGIVTSSGVNMLAELAGDIASGNVAAASQPAADFITDAMSGMANGNTVQAAAAAVNSALQLAEAGGNSATAISVVNNVASLTTQRLSFTQLSTTPTGGFGRVVRKDSSGAGVWAQYVHGKDKVDDMPMDGMRSSYDSQYNGALLGFDFKKIGKYQGGVAFSYGEGDSNSKNSAIKTRSDYKFYGVGYYGNIMNDDSNVMFDVNFSKSESDVEQHNAGYKLEASPDTTTISAGVKLEKLIQNNEVQIVPYAGLRFLSVDTDEYKANIAGKTAFMYAPDRQNIWLLPVGVSLRQENVYDSGWKVTPKIDLSYIWALGDTDSSMTVSIPGVSAVSDLGYTVMDNGSFLGTVGLEASKGNWSYGLNYSYQKGEYQRSDKWYVDVHYSF